MQFQEHTDEQLKQLTTSTAKIQQQQKLKFFDTTTTERLDTGNAFEGNVAMTTLKALLDHVQRKKDEVFEPDKKLLPKDKKDDSSTPPGRKEQLMGHQQQYTILILNVCRGARGDLGQSDDLHPGHYWLCCGPGQCLEVPIPGSEKWRR